MKFEPRRLREQRWIIEIAVATVGVDWAWPLSAVILGASCPDIHPDIRSVLNRMSRFADISREFSKLGAKAEEIARNEETEGHLVTAREHYFSAANLYAAAQWPIWEDDDERNLELSDRKNTCYAQYMKYAASRIESVEVPFEGKSLPGYLRLPRERGGRIPCVLAINGMDGWKEATSPLYGDKFLERGIATLTLDGPGQGESSIRKIKCTADNFAKAGRAAIDFLTEHPEIDPQKIAAWGVSMGSFWAPQIAACDDRLQAVAVGMVCHEPGMKTAFNEASPSFKARYMWMAGYEDEEQFDAFAQKLTLRGVGADIGCPVFIAAGEDDELSPIEHTYAFYDEIKAPKKLLVFEGKKHDLSGPLVRTKVADWINDRLNGKPMESEVVHVHLTGRETKKERL